jgi:hypothetical protein
VEASQILRVRDSIVKMYSMLTGQSASKILTDLDRLFLLCNVHFHDLVAYHCHCRDNYMSAQEALSYGLIDEIVQPNSDKIKSLNAAPAVMSTLLNTEPDPEPRGDGSFGKLVRSLQDMNVWSPFSHINVRSTQNIPGKTR